MGWNYQFLPLIFKCGTNVLSWLKSSPAHRRYIYLTRIRTIVLLLKEPTQTMLRIIKRNQWLGTQTPEWHYTDVIMGTIASQITSLTIVHSTVYPDADQRKYQSSASLAFVRGIHRRLVNSPHKWPVTRKMFPFDDAIMNISFSIDLIFEHCSYSNSMIMVL